MTSNNLPLTPFQADAIAREAQDLGMDEHRLGSFVTLPRLPVTEADYRALRYTDPGAPEADVLESEEFQKYLACWLWCVFWATCAIVAYGLLVPFVAEVTRP